MSAGSGSRPEAVDTPPASKRAPIPGLALGFLIASVAMAASSVIPLSPLVLSLIIAVLAFNILPPRSQLQPGLRFAAKTLLRVGIVLLGLRVSIGDVLDVGPSGLVIVIAVVLSALFGIQWVSRLAGVPKALGFLLACGYAICGQSAILAVAPLSDANEEEIGYAVGLVALFGGMAVLTLPIVNAIALPMSAEVYGVWVGASVHDVAQVVATASAGGDGALVTATVVKLTRVLMLVPLLLGLGLGMRAEEKKQRQRLVPVFILAFAIAVLVRTSGVLPTGVLGWAGMLEKFAMSTAMVGLGASMRFKSLRSLGRRPLAVAAGSWVALTTIALVLATTLIG